MKWMGIYLLGYVIFIAGLAAALWHAGILERIGSTWTAIGLVMAVGLGIMIAVTGSGAKSTVEIDRGA